MIGVALGSLMTLAALANTARAPRPAERERVVERLPRCTVALVLVGADDSAVSRAIDARTGGHGFSHVYLDPCRFDPATRERVFIDYTLARGLHWTTNAYAGRSQARVYFDGELGDEVFGCVASKMGAPFNVAPLVAGVESDQTCAGLIVHCLPPLLRRTIREAADPRKQRCVSPNDLAVFFDVEPGQTTRVSARNGLERV
jgi:hypothetical protein